MTQLFDLKGKVVIVTGAAAGLGAKMSESLAQHGADMVIIDLQISEGLEK